MYTDPRSKDADRLITSEPTLDLGSVLGLDLLLINASLLKQPEVDPKTVIIKAHISGAYLSNIMLDKGIVK